MKVWLVHDWPFSSLEPISYKTINGYAINAKWPSSHMTVHGWDAHHLLCWSCRCNTRPLLGRFHNFRIHQLPLYSFVGLLDGCRNINNLYLVWQGFPSFDVIHIALNALYITRLVMATCRFSIGWTCEGQVSVFPRWTLPFNSIPFGEWDGRGEGCKFQGEVKYGIVV